MHLSDYIGAACCTFPLSASSQTWLSPRSLLLPLPPSPSRLKRKRFRKIYEYLRQVLEQEGLAPPHPADQAALEADFSPFLEDGSPLLDDLDPEVRRDVDVVLQIAAQEQLGHLSDGQVLLDDGLFMHLMEQVVQGPRDYLQPGSSRREAVEEFTFRPTINTDEESLRMVARRRPSHMKIYEILFAEKNSKEEKIQALKHHIEEERCVHQLDNPSSLPIFS